MTSYSDDVDAIAAINAAIPGIAVAYGSANLPAKLTVLPAAVTIVAPGDWAKFGSDEFVVRVYVAAASNGDPGSAYRSCLALLDSFRAAYRATPQVNGRPRGSGAHGSGQNTRGFGTTGFYYTQKWGGADYYGFEIFLPLGPGPAGG